MNLDVDFIYYYKDLVPFNREIGLMNKYVGCNENVGNKVKRLAIFEMIHRLMERVKIENINTNIDQDFILYIDKYLKNHYPAENKLRMHSIITNHKSYLRDVEASLCYDDKLNENDFFTLLLNEKIFDIIHRDMRNSWFSYSAIVDEVVDRLKTCKSPLALRNALSEFNLESDEKFIVAHVLIAINLALVEKIILSHYSAIFEDSIVDIIKGTELKTTMLLMKRLATKIKFLEKDRFLEDLPCVIDGSFSKKRLSAFANSVFSANTSKNKK